MARPVIDADLERYRTLLEPPTEFKDGFNWTTIAGIIFCGLVMLPGSIYLGLMTGGNMGAAATWVTVILFSEISRRALKTMSKQELVVLLYAANIMIAANAMFPGGPFGMLVYRSFLVGSEAARDAGMAEGFPRWWVPPLNSPALLERNLFHPDWLIPIAITFVVLVLGLISRYTLGYALFRVTSDIENLPFPLAPIAAQGAMALAETDEQPAGPEVKWGAAEALGAWGKGARHKGGSSRWRLFSLGVTIGLAFGFMQVGIPALTGLFLAKPIFLIPQPFIDTTTLTEKLMPATPTGVAFDLGVILTGFVLPFWAVVGSFAAILLTAVVNPILHGAGILTSWQPGMNTVNATFGNSIDFWLSFGIGTGAGIALVSVYSTIRDIRQRLRQEHSGARSDSLSTPPRAGRGDYPIWMALVAYAVASIAVIALVHHLVPQLPVLFLFIFSFLYNPFISYVNARLLGIAGQTVDIPYVRETSFILSGAKGVDIWLAPVPLENYGGLAQSFRVNELTGVRFWSLIKAELVALPTLFVLSLLFWAFIWRAEAVPSAAFPAAQVNWELAAKNNVLLFSSTFVPAGEDPASKSLMDSQFMRAIHPLFIGSGFSLTVIVFALLSVFRLPTLLLYGFVRGIGALPHYMLLEIVGAVVGRYYYQKKYGASNFLRMAPTILAGYYTGVGLISMATIGMTLIKASISSLPF
ncbi:MAG TPA: peptide transporter [Armatimonadota bacterium]|jgi:hypothetical protein